MTTKMIRIYVSAAMMAGTVGLVGCGSSGSGHDMGSMGTTTPTSSATSRVPSSAAPATGSHNDADVMFATMMIPHHAQAIEMSETLLAKDGIDAKVRNLATGIKAAQSPEIRQMGAWLTGWGKNPSPSDMGGMNHGDGMMSQAEMDALKNATGTKAVDVYLTGMIRHHEGAVTMARGELDHGKNPDARKLAQAIITNQNAEIDQMRTMLAK